MTMTQEAPAITTAQYVGQMQADGTVYLGSFTDPKDNLMKDWYATAEDAKDARGRRLRLNFNDAASYTQTLEAHGHNDWQAAPDTILAEQQKAQNTADFHGTYKDKFKKSECETPYMSGTPHPRCKGYGAVQYFDEPEPAWASETNVGFLRPVRAVCSFKVG